MPTTEFEGSQFNWFVLFVPSGRKVNVGNLVAVTQNHF
jgi:hypothetical protein